MNLAKELSSRTWRTTRTHDRYETERQADLADETYCPLCEAPSIKEFKHWRIIGNKYPHDAVAVRHEMVIPRRHLLEAELCDEAKTELYQLKYNEFGDEYVYLTEALPKHKSVPGHFHLHLIVPKVID